MDIVSIKKYLTPDSPKPRDYIRFLQLLLNGISLHAVDANEIELTRFRQEVSNISETLNVRSTAEEIEAALGFVIRAVTGYNGMAARITRAHVNELQAMLNMMSRTIAFLSQSSKTGVEQLQAIEKNLQRASTIGDVRQLRGKLNDCLVLVRSESLRLREESQSHLAELQSEVERTVSHVRSSGFEVPAEVPTPEPRSQGTPEIVAPVAAALSASVLQHRETAERIITANISRGQEFVVALFVVDRFALLQARFGNDVCEQVLELVHQYLEEQMGPVPLFQWSGGAYAAILAAGRPLQELEQEMTGIAARRFQKTIEKDRRITLLPITCSSIVRKGSDLDSPADIVESLDDFVATKAD